MMTFTPAFGLANPHLQTLLPRFIHRNPQFTPEMERIETPDDDFLDIAWTESPHNIAPDKPILVLFHGLEGSIRSPYAHGLLHAAKRHGWLGVMMHFRGCSHELNRQDRFYHSGETEDAHFFIQHLKRRFPNQPLLAVGISLGGNMLVNYLAQTGENSGITAAQVVSAPLQLQACAGRIEQGFSKVYRSYLLGSLKKRLIGKIERGGNTMPVTKQQAEQITSLRQFDDLVTAPLHGFQNADDYYQQCSGMQYLAQVSTPLRLIHAKDDPFMTDEVIPTMSLPPHIEYTLYQHGGHVGFVTGSLLKPKMWLEKTIPVWFTEQLALHKQSSHGSQV
ncbi:TPA: hydrolase [Photobacterium damselae]